MIIPLIYIDPWIDPKIYNPNCMVNEVMGWAKETFEQTSKYIKKAWVYIQRIPDGIKTKLWFIEDGNMHEISRTMEISWDEIVRQYNDNLIEEELFHNLEIQTNFRIGVLER